MAMNLLRSSVRHRPVLEMLTCCHARSAFCAPGGTDLLSLATVPDHV